MLKIALKMLIGDKAKYLAITLGISFASLIITQQSAIFVGIMGRTCGFITDTNQADIWVMDSKVQFADDIKPLKDTDLWRVKSLKEVAWAVPLYKGQISARMSDGTFQNCIYIGLDDATFVGEPPHMINGTIKDLKAPDAIIVDSVGAGDKLAIHINEREKRPLQIGDVLELNDHRAVVVGICQTSRTFESQPVIYTTYNRATAFSPQERKMLSFILVKAKSDPEKVAKIIAAKTGLQAYTNDGFKKLTVHYYLTNTGILINFGTAVLMGFIIGIAIVGQTFYNFILDNIRFLAIFKAMGAKNSTLIKMNLLQISFVGALGWGIGSGVASLFGFLALHSELSFHLPWQLYILSGAAIGLICLLSALVCFWKIFKIEPAIAFKS